MSEYNKNFNKLKHTTKQNLAQCNKRFAKLLRSLAVADPVKRRLVWEQKKHEIDLLNNEIDKINKDLEIASFLKNKIKVIKNEAF